MKAEKGIMNYEFGRREKGEKKLITEVLRFVLCNGRGL
jgi:hypothetical protein